MSLCKTTLGRLTAIAIWLSLPAWAGAVLAADHGRFSIQDRDGWAWFVRPDGTRFFSRGVCCVTPGAARKDYDVSNPQYAAWQHYVDSNAWARATLHRLGEWGFRTIGGWSDFQALRHGGDENVMFAPVLHVGSTAGAPWWDMWDATIVERMHTVAREQILALQNDRRVIGYYSDNEMGWWNGILFKMTLEQAATSGQRQRLIDLLRESYRNDWSALTRDFEPAPGVENWEGLSRHGILFLRPGGEGIRVERRFLEILAERYYSLVREIILKYDPHALVLGDRFQSFYYPEVARAAAKYVDAISSNLNAGWNDGTFARFYLRTLHEITGKPVAIGEFYMSARDNRSGNKNDRGTYPVVATQKERAAGFRATIEHLVRTPFVVGADWFQYFDEPTHGRFDGENFNFGLVDIHDRPYEPLVNAARRFDVVRSRRQPPSSRADAGQGVPPAPSDPFAEFTPTLALKKWDRERGYVAPASTNALADLYVCWNKHSIYFGLYAQDVTEDVFYRDKVVPVADRAEWTVSFNGVPGEIRARLGAGREPTVEPTTIRVVNLSGVNGNFRNVAALEVPSTLLGQSRFRAGDVIEFKSTFVGHCRGYRTDWSGRFTLRK